MRHNKSFIAFERKKVKALGKRRLLAAAFARACLRRRECHHIRPSQRRLRYRARRTDRRLHVILTLRQAQGKDATSREHCCDHANAERAEVRTALQLLPTKDDDPVTDRTFPALPTVELNCLAFDIGRSAATTTAWRTKVTVAAATTASGAAAAVVAATTTSASGPACAARAAVPAVAADAARTAVSATT
jgi:hypothetical protein